MEITQLQYFKTIAQTENITHAAKILNVSQSALSKSIAKLEDELELELFERSGNRIWLNRHGAVFLSHVEHSLMTIEDSIRATKESAGLEEGEIKVAICQDVFIKHLIQEFLFDHPDISFHCSLLPKEEIARRLETGSIDFSVTTDPIVGNDLVWEPLFIDSLEIMVGKSHPLADRKTLSLSSLSEERFIISNVAFGIDNATHSLCRKAGFTPKIMYSGYDSDMPMAFIASGHAVMITPYTITRGVRSIFPTPDMSVKCIPLTGADELIHKTIGITKKSGHFISKATLTFYKSVVQYYEMLKMPQAVPLN